MFYIIIQYSTRLYYIILDSTETSRDGTALCMRGSDSCAILYDTISYYIILFEHAMIYCGRKIFNSLTGLQASTAPEILR